MRKVRSMSRRIARITTGAGRALASAWATLQALPGLLRRWWRALRAAAVAALAALQRTARWAAQVARAVVDRLVRIGRTTFLVALLAGALAVLIGGSAFAASRLNAEYGAGSEQENAVSWGGQRVSYAGATCQECHSAQLAAQALIHASVSCEGCHGPLVGHPASNGGSSSRLVLPNSEPCITCHATAAGRPPGFPEIAPANHYPGNECLGCHDAHHLLAGAPPDVTHPLIRLPACTTCHAPDGLKEVPSGHEMVDDEACLSCHGVPADDD